LKAEPGPSSRRTLALLAFLVSLSMSGFSLVGRRQLAGLGGIVDEWFLVGLNMRVSGTLGIQAGRPDVVLAPGYPLFVAAVAAVVGNPRSLTPEYVERCVRAVFLAQALLLAGAASMIFLWISRHVGAGIALAMALAFGTNPYPLILTGLLHYDVLHMFCLVASCWCWQWALDDAGRHPMPMLCAGLLWGVTTLVRTVTLVLPLFAFLALALRERRGLRQALARCGLLTLGMLLVIGPYTLRNRHVTGRWVAVNAEGWMAIWGSSVRTFATDPNHYNWGLLYPEPFMDVFTAVTGQASYSRAAFIDHNLALEDAFRREAMSNIRQRPLVYLGNCVRSFVTFNTRINSVFIKVFRHVQRPHTWPAQEWFRVGHPQEFEGAGAALAFSAFIALLTTLAVAGAWLAVRQRLAWALAPGFAYLTICAAHTVVYMDLMYYYVKLPFLFIFAAPFLDWAARRRSGTRLTAGDLGAGIVLASSLALSFFVLSTG
jgi:hypothetical protein